LTRRDARELGVLGDYALIYIKKALFPASF
jgi:hypothetical protein